MNLKDILSSNVYLSLTLGVIVSTIVFCINYNKPEDTKFKKHLKLVGITAICVFLALYLKGNTNKVGGGNTSSSWNSSTTLEDINLDDTFNI